MGYLVQLRPDRAAVAERPLLLSWRLEQASVVLLLLLLLPLTRDGARETHGVRVDDVVKLMAHEF